ncbi:MAG TPA: hypothetical protein VGG85_01605 [Terracidiphilus sp.]
MKNCSTGFCIDIPMIQDCTTSSRYKLRQLISTHEVRMSSTVDNGRQPMELIRNSSQVNPKENPLLFED